MESTIFPSRSYPLGATVYPHGVNFCIYSKNATLIELLLFDHADQPHPTKAITLHPKHNRTFHYWHVFIPGIRAGQIYAYRVHGPFNPEQGHRFDPNKVLIDPYARAIVGNYSRQAAIEMGDNCAQALKGVVVDRHNYNWEGDEPLKHPYNETIIYELHVGGFTKNPNSGVSPAKRGTYAGLIEKIPYLKELGITAVELLPIQEFDEQDVKDGLVNYWGYSPIAFFAPHRAYSSRQDLLGPLDEFRDMVKALHKAGIEVILDVVFNHTAEGNENGPTFCFRGLENSAYYILENNSPAYYANYTGCGNTFKANHHVVLRLILDCLCFWVAEMHVDGFRFDLASVLARGESGHPLDDPPVLWAIESDPILAGTKIIAEAWDAAGLYQVGSFIGDRFAEWNGPYRDDARQFAKSTPGVATHLAARIMGSPDIYPELDREPNHSINFITCHDGFTMNDLVAYNEKHNEANLEDSQDGCNHNYSWNCGIEGDTDDPEINALRLQQIKNFYTILFFSQGTPMILMGDEVRRSQQGNNNGYCQDNQLSWFDWDQLDKQQDLLRFVKGVISVFKTLNIFRVEKVLATVGPATPEVISHVSKIQRLEATRQPHISWHGVKLWKPDWGENSHAVAFTLRYPEHDEYLHIIFNAYWEPLTFELPRLLKGENWYRIVDTSLPSPDDFSQLVDAQRVNFYEYQVKPRSAVILRAL